METQRLEQPFYRMMQDAGLVHILAVSGLHIGMAAAFCRKGLEKIGICRRTVELISLLPVWGYIALTGFSLRRCGQASWQPFAGLGWVLGRERDGLSSLAVAACSMLLVSPYLLYSLSFLLSFWITFGLLLCTPGLSRLWEQSAFGAALIGRRGTPRFLHIFQHRLSFAGSRYLRDAGAALPLSCAFGVERSGSSAFAVGGPLGDAVRLALAGCHAALSECGSRAVFVGSPGAGRACGIVCPLDFAGGKNGQPPAVSGGFLQPPVAAGSDPVDCTGLGAHPAWI